MIITHPTSNSRVARSARGGDEAYTLTEVIVAVLLVGILTISLYAGFSSGFVVVQLTREELRATQIMMRKVEAMRLVKWSDLRNISFTEYYDPLGGATNAGGVVYAGTLTINAASAIPDSASYKTNMVLVRISINWTNTLGGTTMIHNRQLETLVARYGIQNYVYGQKQ